MNKKLSLNVNDRFNIQVLLPKEGSFIEMTQKESVLEKVKISSEEIEELEMQEGPEGSGITWNPEKEKEKKISLTEGEISLLVKGFEKLDEKGKITMELLPLCRKIKSLEPSKG